VFIPELDKMPGIWARPILIAGAAALAHFGYQEYEYMPGRESDFKKMAKAGAMPSDLADAKADAEWHIAQHCGFVNDLAEFLVRHEGQKVSSTIIREMWMSHPAGKGAYGWSCPHRRWDR
jgi:hypothetical protein